MDSLRSVLPSRAPAGLRWYIPCESPAIAAPGSLDVDWVVQGCGQRITYRFLAWAGHTWQPVVVARVAMPAGDPVRPSDPPQAMAP